jgi:NAD(P)-dependent dehydrogenase (short-subunit alcohol dehydrogenase family)
MAEQGVLQRMWSGAKTWHALRIGPITFYYRLARSFRSGGGARLVSLHRRFRARPRANAACLVSASTLTSQTARTDPANQVALIVGMGAEIGPAIARTLADDGMHVVLASRDSGNLRSLALEIRARGGRVRAFTCDVTHEASVEALLRRVCSDIGAPNLVVYGVQGWNPGSVLETQVAAFEEAWRSSCLGAFVVGRESARAMIAAGRGTIVFLGATSGTIGRTGYLNLAVGKFGLRALAQVMARELGPQGVHVAHVVIDADVSSGVDPGAGASQTEPEALAAVVRSLHQQPRSCWTHELDVRPWNEAFWQHC